VEKKSRKKKHPPRRGKGAHHPHHHGHGDPHDAHEHHGMGSGQYLSLCLLLLLSRKNSYGYELLERLGKATFTMRIPGPGTVYKNLRMLEEHKFLKSDWVTKSSGPAKRVYKITREGREILEAWSVSLRQHKKALEDFLAEYQKSAGRRPR
jgi:DNA-binding PadR family transcriptional regulator